MRAIGVVLPTFVCEPRRNEHEALEVKQQGVDGLALRETLSTVIATRTAVSTESDNKVYCKGEAALDRVRVGQGENGERRNSLYYIS